MDQPASKIDWSDPQFHCLKYVRVGYQDRGRLSDALVQSFVKQIPGDGELPHRWRYSSLDKFLSRYGELGTILWSKSYNAHLLMIGGHHILRIWTDASKHCWVDLHPTLGQDKTLAPTGMIPSGNGAKSKPFLMRKKIDNVEDMQALAKRVKEIWGI